MGQNLLYKEQLQMLNISVCKNIPSITFYIILHQWKFKKGWNILQTTIANTKYFRAGQVCFKLNFLALF